MIGEMLEKVETRNQELVCGRDKMIDMEGNEYATVETDFYCWMAENIRIETDNHGNFVDRYCYDEDPVNCKLYGGLYDWDTATIICPPGWRLPGDDDFKDMEVFLGMPRNEVDTTGWRGSPVGDMIKDVSWDGTGEFGFRSLPAGFMNPVGIFEGLGDHAHFWGSGFSGDRAWRRYLHSNESRISRLVAYKNFAFSVRCIKR